MTTWPYIVDTFTTKVDGETVQASHVNAPQSSIVAIETEEARTYRPDLKPVAPSAYDDEFETGLLDPKWTAINCATGTVDLLSVAAAKDCYDATTYQGMMALQPGRDNGGAAGIEAEAAMLRQTIAPAATCKFVAKTFGQATNQTNLAAAPELSYGLMLSGANGAIDNNFLLVGLAPLPFQMGGGSTSGAAVSGVARIGGGAPVLLNQSGHLLDYLMITKTGNNFSAFAGDGHSWAAMTDGTGPADNTVFAFGAGVMVRLSLVSYFLPIAAEVNLFNPITTFDFVRYFTNNTPLVNA